MEENTKKISIIDNKKSIELTISKFSAMKTLSIGFKLSRLFSDNSSIDKDFVSKLINMILDTGSDDNLDLSNEDLLVDGIHSLMSGADEDKLNEFFTSLFSNTTYHIESIGVVTLDPNNIMDINNLVNLTKTVILFNVGFMFSKEKKN